MSLLTDARSAPPGTGIRFYGWRVVAMCALTLGMTAPGQLPRFGTRHLGSIRGVGTLVMVVGTAVGPSLLALGRP